MSSNGASTSLKTPLAPKRLSKRAKLRNGTFIIPSTGERSRRQFTLRTSGNLSSAHGSNDFPTEPHVETRGDWLKDRSQALQDRASALWTFFNSDRGHGVLKCTLAYLLGSTATFWSPMSSFLGNRDGKHIVATLTVYFHPARTVGSMLEAVLIAIVAVVYAEIVCVLSMAVAIASRAHLGAVEPAHVLVLIFSVGFGLGLVGWVKQKLNQPLVNVASTLASMAIISVVTKEESIQDGYFSGDKIIQVFKMLLLGIFFTFVVNLLVWRVSARRVLRESITTASICLSDRLSFVARGFLIGSDEELESPEYAHVTARYNYACTMMGKMLGEAKYEHYLFGGERLFKLDKRVVRSIEALSRAIGGLRSALDTQFTLLKEESISASSPPASETPDSGLKVLQLDHPAASALSSQSERLSVIDEFDEDEDATIYHTSQSSSLLPMSSPPKFQSPSEIFEFFIALLGPSMKSLSFTLTETLRSSPFGNDPKYDIVIKDRLRESLQEALILYDRARGNALFELYRGIEIGRSRSEEIEADIEEVAAACGHFSFSLKAVAEEMDSYLGALEDLQRGVETNAQSWNWLKFWHHFKFRSTTEHNQCEDPERESLLAKRSSVKGIKRTAIPKGTPAGIVKHRDTFNWDAAPHTSAFLRSFSQKTLRVLRFLSREDILFGIKVGIGAILWAMFAFIPGTRPTYQHWRGEWGLLSFMIVVGMTTGASNTTGTARFIGTMIGASLACVSWLICFENPWALAIVGALVALWNFYLILVLNNAPLGRISLLAYNVIVLYAYSISQDVDDDDDDEGGTHPLIFNITYHRVIAVTLGILWGMIVCRFLWPISGREKFRQGLSALYLQLGLIWKRGPLGVLMEQNGTVDYLGQREQAALQRYAFRLEALCSSAKSEFELRGPFPHQAYSRIMRSTRHILDGFYAMRLITQRRRLLSDGERAILRATSEERVALCQRICHVFQVLASCIMLEYPLTDVIPTIDSTKDRLLNKVYQFRKGHHTNEEVSAAGAVAEERDYALLYAYTLVTAQVAEELKNVRGEIEMLFGVLDEELLLLE